MQPYFYEAINKTSSSFLFLFLLLVKFAVIINTLNNPKLFLPVSTKVRGIISHHSTRQFVPFKVSPVVSVNGKNHINL